MFSKKKLLIGSLILGVLGFSPMLMTVVGKGDKKGHIKLNPNYYNSEKETLFNTETKSV